MKLPNYRALALLGLLTLAGLIAPREGAALRIIGWGEEDRPIKTVYGDPDTPFGRFGRNFYFRAGPGRIVVIPTSSPRRSPMKKARHNDLRTR